MPDLDLETLSLEELRDLRGQVDRAIAGYTDRKRREAIAAAEEAVRAHGFNTLAELTRGSGRPGRPGRGAAAARSAAAKPASEARYANPDDASQTWSGRGRRPSWVKQHVEAGRKLEELAL